MIVKCPDCGQTLEVPDLPRPSITNLPSCSVIVFEHPVPVTCSCGAEFVPFVTAVGSCDVIMRKVVRPDGPRVVIPSVR